MTRSTNRIALVIAALVVATLSVLLIGPESFGFQGKPVREEPINTFFNAPPGNVADMVNGADAVVQVRMIGTSSSRARTGGAGPMTANRFQVIEVIHNFAKHVVEPDALDVFRPSGDIDRGAYIERAYQVGFPEFQPGHRYLLFLSWNEALVGWVPAYGPDSVFDLTTGRPRAFGQTSVSRSLAATSVDDLLTRVRFLGK
jgi:hypothetical protein